MDKLKIIQNAFSTLEFLLSLKTIPFKILTKVEQSDLLKEGTSAAAGGADASNSTNA